MLVQKHYRLAFLGGPDDGAEFEASLEFLPEVIDGESYHFFGDKAYVLLSVDHENKVAQYEHIKVGNNVDKGEGIGGDEIQPSDPPLDNE